MVPTGLNVRISAFDFLMKEVPTTIITHVNQLTLDVARSKSKTFLAFCFCFLIASGMFSAIKLPPGVVWYLFFPLFSLVAVLILFWEKINFRFFILCFVFFICGAIRVAITIPDCSDKKNLCSFNDKRLSVNGIVASEPDNKIDGVTYIIASNKANGENVTGKFLLKTRSYPLYNYGDELSVTCKLEQPKNTPDSTFRYDKYLERYGVRSLCSYPDVQKIAEGNGNVILENILKLKSLLNGQISRLWPEPEASFMAGILYGARNGLPKYLAEDFSRTGVSHIVAVSGFNITIITVILLSAFIAAGFYRQRAFYAVAVTLFLFIALCGFSASAIRAGIMGTAVLSAGQFGRKARMFNVLVFSAAVMQLSNPYLLLWDAGFQLSFLALIGLVYVSPIIDVILSKAKDLPISNRLETKKILRHVPYGMWLRFNQNDKINFIIKTLIQTISAIIMTLPLILYQFGTLSLVAPLVNVLILWIIPFLMLGGAVSMISSFIFLPLGKVFAGITHFGLSYVIMVVMFFGEKPWASTDVRIPLWGMVVAYAFLILVILKFEHISD